LNWFPGTFATRIATPLDEVLALVRGATAIEEFRHDVLVISEPNFISDGEVWTKIGNGNKFIFDDAVF
jgi:hypothetical protein